jgi:hypothetical protein
VAVRKFVAASRIRVNIGACGFTGAATFVGLLNFERTGGENSWCSAVDSTKANQGNFYDCLAKTEGNLGIYRNGTYSEAKEVTKGIDGIWALVAVTKEAGTVAARAHVYRFDTKAWTHTACVNALTNATANAGGYLQFGQWGEADQLRALYAAAAAWGKVLTDKEIEELVAVSYLEEWLKRSPAGLWLFKQQSGAETVKDLTGNGADQAELVGTEYSAAEPPIPYAPSAAPSVVLPPPSEPATRLAISLLNPDESVNTRWGPDEQAVANVPKGLSFSTADPGLFKDATVALARPIDLPWPDLSLLRDVRIHGVGRRTAWEGRLQEIPLHYAEDYSINPAAVGHSSQLDYDPSFREIYVGRDLGEWTELSAQWRLGWAGSLSYAGFSVAPDSGEGRPSLALELNGHWEAQKPVAAAMYDAGAGCIIAALDYEYALNTADATFILELFTGTDDKPTGGASLGDLVTSAASSGSGELKPGKRVMAWQWYYANINAGQDGAQYRALMRRLAWFGGHGLTIRGAAPNRGLYGSDVIADIVKRCAPELNYTTGPAGSIEPSTYIIPHLVFRDPVKGSDAILAVNAYHQRTWGVEEGKRFFWRSALKSRKRWRIRRSKGHGIDLLGPQAETAINGVVVTFTDPAGVTRVVGPPGCAGADVTSEVLADTSDANPVNLAGIPRKWGELQLSFVTDYTGAIQVGYAWLVDKLQNANARGSVTVSGVVEDDESGALFPAWYMRAGDSAIVTDGDNIERRIIETNYDHDTRTVTCNMDTPPNKVEALMERMGIALVGEVD